MTYIYNDEDNAPMNDDSFDSIDKDGHNPTVYLSAYEARMYDKYGEPEPLPFDEQPDGCWNCMNYDYKHEACTLTWNNMDESYYNPETDDKDPDDWCPGHDTDKDAVWEDWFGNE